MSTMRYLQGVGLFASFSPSELEAVAGAAGVTRRAAGAHFFHQGDPARMLYVLQEGQVKLTQLAPDGQQVVLGFVRPGGMLGAIAALGDQAYPATAQAVVETSALGWDGATMARLMESYPALARNALSLVTARVQELQNRLREMATERVERRLARAILRLARQLGRKVEGGVFIDMPLSRQDLAEMTGATLFTVSRIMSRWEQAGLIAGGREQVVIRHPHGLVTIAEDLPQASEAESHDLF